MGIVASSWARFGTVGSFWIWLSLDGFSRVCLGLPQSGQAWLRLTIVSLMICLVRSGWVQLFLIESGCHEFPLLPLVHRVPSGCFRLPIVLSLQLSQVFSGYF